MFASIGTSFRLTGASFRLVFQYPVVLILPVFTLLAVGALVVGPISFLIWMHQNHPDAAADFWKNLYFITYNAAKSGNWEFAITSAIVETYVLYAIWLTIALTFVLYFSCVGMHVATTQIRRGKPDLGEGFQVATRNLGRIFLLAAFNATVLTWIMWAVKYGPLRWIPIAGKWIVRGVRLVLTAVTYLMLPIVVYERAGAWNAFRSAWQNVRKTWSGVLIGTGIVFFATWLLFNVVAFGLLQRTFGIETTSILSLAFAAILFAVSTAVSSAMRAVLYWYATTGEVPAGFNKADLPAIQTPGPLTGIGAVGMVGVPTGPRTAAPPARATGSPMRPAAQAPGAPAGARQQLACPRCHTVIVVAWGAKPVCPTCGFGK